MTRDERLQRLRMALKVAGDGAFVVVSGRVPVLGGTSIRLDSLLDMTDIGDRLRALAGDDAIEVLADKGVTDAMLRSLNHRRDQYARMGLAGTLY